MSLAVEPAQERLMYQEPEAFSYSTASDTCKNLGMVLYNGRCMHRNTPCCNGKGYLGQRKEDLGWGVCIDWRTKGFCTNAPKQTNQPQSIIDYARPFLLFGNQNKPPAAAPSAPTTTRPPSGSDPDADCNNFPLGKGLCVLGKSFQKGITGVGSSAGEWAKNPIAQFMPVILVGGGIMLLAILVKGK